MRQFARQGHPLKALDRMLATYRQRRYEAEAGPGAGPGRSRSEPSAGHARPRPARVSLGLGSSRGSARSPGPSTPPKSPRAPTTLRAASAPAFGKQEDVQLVLDPLRCPHSRPGRRAEPGRGRVPWIALFFDTYERTGPFLDGWLRDLITTERYGSLPAQVVVTTAGQRPFDPNRWADCVDFVTDLPLAPFTETEARQLLTAKGVVDEEVVREVLRLSGRLPVLVSTLAENPGAVDDPSATAVERFLKWEQDPVRRSAALDGALPRRLNEDVFRAAAEGDERRGLFGWLCGAAVRERPRRPGPVPRRRTGPDAAAAAQQLAAALAGRRTPGWPRRSPAGGRRPGRASTLTAVGTGAWRELRIEETYHLLCARPRTALPAVLRDGVDACDAGHRSSPGAGRGPSRTRAPTATSDCCATLGRDASPRWRTNSAECATVLELILARGELAHEARVSGPGRPRPGPPQSGRVRAGAARLPQAITLDERLPRAHYGLGETHRLTGRFEESLAEFGRALELDPADTWSSPAAPRPSTCWGAARRRWRDLDQVIEARPGHVWSLVRRSQVRRALGDVDGALADIGRAEQLDPDNPWIVGERGEILRHDGRWRRRSRSSTGRSRSTRRMPGRWAAAPWRSRRWAGRTRRWRTWTRRWS